MLEFFEDLYRKYNRKEFIHPDPLEIVLQYIDRREQEIAGLIASSLSLGRVSAILDIANLVFARLHPLRETVLFAGVRELRRRFAGFTYRFYTSEHVVGLILGIRTCIEKYGSLGHCFRSFIGTEDRCVYPSLGRFVSELSTHSQFAPAASCPLLPLPERGSGCKRLNLYLRWMVRRDDVDPGCWNGIDPSLLLVPVDTHMLRLCQSFGITRRKQANMRTCFEITSFFRGICPEDPVRYDFSFTRLGIHPELKKLPVERFAAPGNGDLTR